MYSHVRVRVGNYRTVPGLYTVQFVSIHGATPCRVIVVQVYRPKLKNEIMIIDNLTVGDGNEPTYAMLAMLYIL